MNIQKVVLNYLQKQARVPQLPPGLLEDIFTWAAPLYKNNLLTLYGKQKRPGLFAKRPKTFYKTFSVPQVLPYGKINQKKIYLRIVPEQKSYEAIYHQALNAIFIYLPFLSDETKNNIQSKLDMLEQDLYHKLYHELIHFVQLNTDKDIGGKTDTYRDYLKYEEDYDISPIEYKPNLISAIGEFKYDFANKPYTIQDVKEFLGPNSSLAFFRSLYKRAPQRWKKAVKDFYILLQRNS